MSEPIRLSPEQKRKASHAWVDNWTKNYPLTISNDPEMVEHCLMSCVDAFLDAVNTEPEPTLLEEVTTVLMQATDDQPLFYERPYVRDWGLVAQAAIDKIREKAPGRLENNRLVQSSTRIIKAGTDEKQIINAVLGEALEPRKRYGDEGTQS